MQSKFPRDYFVFLKSVGLVGPVTAPPRSSERSRVSQARGVGGREDPPSCRVCRRCPDPTPRFGLGTWAVRGFDAQLRDPRLPLRRGQVFSEEFARKTRVARKRARCSSRPRAARRASTFSGPRKLLPARSGAPAGLRPRPPPHPPPPTTFYDLFRNKQTQLQENPNPEC